VGRRGIDKADVCSTAGDHKHTSLIAVVHPLQVIKAREDVLERLKVAAEKLDSAMGGTAPLALPPADPLVRLFFRWGSSPLSLQHVFGYSRGEGWGYWWSVVSDLHHDSQADLTFLQLRNKGTKSLHHCITCALSNCPICITPD
jgi:hypothetical protein